MLTERMGKNTKSDRNKNKTLISNKKKIKIKINQTFLEKQY